MRSMYTPAVVQRKWHEVRRYSRFHCNWRLTVTCFRGDTLTFWGRASDISEEGLAATIVGELNVKEVISIHLNIPLRFWEVRCSGNDERYQSRHPGHHVDNRESPVTRTRFSSLLCLARTSSAERGGCLFVH